MTQCLVGGLHDTTVNNREVSSISHARDAADDVLQRHLPHYELALMYVCVCNSIEISIRCHRYLRWYVLE
jgi:hypothetical protein